MTHFSEYLIAEQRPVYGIKLVHQAIVKLQDNKEQVCGSLHREYAKLCIKAKCFQHSLVIVE